MNDCCDLGRRSASPLRVDEYPSTNEAEQLNRDRATTSILVHMYRRLTLIEGMAGRDTLITWVDEEDMRLEEVRSGISCK